MSESTLVDQIVRGQDAIDRMKHEIAVVIGTFASQAIDAEGGESNHLTLVKWSDRNTEYEWRLYPSKRSVGLLTGPVGIEVFLYHYRLHPNDPPMLKLKHVVRVHYSLGKFVDAILQRYPKFRDDIAEPLIRAAQLNPPQ